MTLRIEKKAEKGGTLIMLIGEIQEEDLAGLRTQLKDSDSSVILDLEEVRLVDAEVVRFLAECESDGVKIRNCSA